MSSDLVKLALRMGLEGAELKAWVEEREAQARDDRAAEREVIKEKMEQMELERKLEAEAQKTLQLRLQLAQAQGVRESVVADEGRQVRASSNVNPHNFMPGFNENRDDLDAYLKRFENIATGQDWPKDKWATALSLCLSGEALKVFGRLAPEEALDYDKTKLALLQRFRFTAEGYREKFRHSKPQDGETGVQYAARLTSFFDRWVEMSKTEKEYSAVRNLVVAEQFINSCHDKVALFLREKNCRKLEEMAEAADNFLEAQRQTNLQIFREKAENTSRPYASGLAWVKRRQDVSARQVQHLRQRAPASVRDGQGKRLAGSRSTTSAVSRVLGRGCHRTYRATQASAVPSQR
ncbi:uncharacterized protein LOC119403475 [Rhipicephalus sanguineus]|uniref:uncharacterized protein LOC119403475 n=1 Tax=Rhipicephalus sanguineus TaxID=34632 RepID=UPI001895B1F6|nr:uncharacterized protein LOC119403475 [Rhipicephalus sanguineus]